MSPAEQDIRTALGKLNAALLESVQHHPDAVPEIADAIDCAEAALVWFKPKP